MTDSHNACSAATEDDFQALREVEEAWLASELGRAISNLAYPVGCGAAPTDYHLKAAAKALFDRYAKMVEMARNTGAPAQPAPELLFCHWLKGYLGAVKGRDELTPAEANTIRGNLNELLSASQPSPAATVETENDHNCECSVCAERYAQLRSSAATDGQCDQCPEPMEGPHHPECYRFVEAPAVSSDDLIPLFRDAASVNMSEDAVERQAKRFAEAVLSLYDVRRK